MLDPYQMLANAIVEKACTDYRREFEKLMRYKKNKTYTKNGHTKRAFIELVKEVDDIEWFFRSSYFCILTDLDGEYLINMLQLDVLEKLRKEEEERLRKEEDERRESYA